MSIPAHLSRLAGLAALAVALVPMVRATPPRPPVPQQESEARPRFYTLTSGSRLRATIVESAGQRVRLRVHYEGGSAMQWYYVADFEPSSQVRLAQEQVPEGNVLAQLEVAELAEGFGLIDLARIELKRCAYIAEETSTSLRGAHRERAIALTLRLIEALCARGDVAQARSGVSWLLTRRPPRLSPGEQELLLRSVEEAAARAGQVLAEARRGDEDEQAAALRAGQLASIHRHVRAGKEDRRSGLLGSDQYVEASRDLTSAVGHFEDALGEITKLREESARDPILLGELGAEATEAQMLLRDTYLSRASMELARGKFGDAMLSVETILADEPSQPQALAMRARVELAQSDWGW